MHSHVINLYTETDGHDHQVNDNPDDQVDGNPDDQVDGNPDDQVDNNPEDQVGGNPDDGMDKEAKEIDKSNISCSEGHTMWSVGGDVHKEEPATPPISFKIKVLVVITTYLILCYFNS